MQILGKSNAARAFWVTADGRRRELTRQEAENLPVLGRSELSNLPLKDCRDVLVDYRDGQGTMFWDARRTGRVTIDHSFDLLKELGPMEGMRFHTFIDAWLTTDFTNEPDAIRQLDWFSRYRNTLLLPGTKVAEKTIADMQKESAFLTSAFSAWRDAAKGGDPNLLLSIVNHALLYERLEKGGPMQLAYPGQLHPISLIYGKDWQRRTMTMDQLQQTTDDRYEERVTDVYEDVITCKQPRYDHIHGFVRIKDGLPRWARYRRLLLPWPAVGKARAIYCLSEPTNRIDIPFIEVV
ncbi:MAG: hypothetical protein RIM72_11430 [Alphaproteobacteria bacterium]